MLTSSIDMGSHGGLLSTVCHAALMTIGWHCKTAYFRQHGVVV